MVNTDKEQNQISNPTKVTDSTKKACPFKWLSAVLILITLIAAGYASFTSYQLRQSVNTQANQLTQMQKKNQADLDATQQTKTSLLAMQNQIDTLSKNVNTILPQRLYQKQDWLLLKVRYFLELAQVNAHWTDDNQTTIALLTQADELLTTITNQKSYQLRQSIVNEISTLKALPTIDRAGLLSQLDAAQNSIAALPIRQVAALQPAESAHQPSDPSTPSWKKKMRQGMNLLERLVVIRHHETPIQPLLSPMHELLIRDSLKMNLQQAQWAILQKNIPVYQLSLTQALTNLQKYFDNQAASTQALIKSLEELQGETIQQKQPPIEQSLALITAWIESNNAELNTISREGETQP